MVPLSDTAKFALRAVRRLGGGRRGKRDATVTAILAKMPAPWIDRCRAPRNTLQNALVALVQGGVLERERVSRQFVYRVARGK